MTPADQYFLLLYNKAYEKISEWTKKMHEREFGSPEWQIAQKYQRHYADLCVWLSENSPTALGYHPYKKIDTRDNRP